LAKRWSLLDEKGTPGIVQRALIRPPAARLGPVTPAERQAVMANSPVRGKYDAMIDRESAYERLQARAKEAAVDVEAVAEAQAKTRATNVAPAPRASTRQSIGEAMAKSVVRSVGSSIGRQIVRGILGSIFKGR